MIAYIALGSNIKPIYHLQKAAEYLDIERASGIYQSTSLLKDEQPNYLNQVVKIQTPLSPHALLARLKDIEAEMGRKRRFRLGPREIDLDILLYEAHVIDTPQLTIPHIGLYNRDFFLYPLKEISPDLILPCGTSLVDLVRQSDNNACKLLARDIDHATELHHAG